MRAVLDCNVYVSALIRPGGAPARILDALVAKKFESVLSNAILAELRRVLSYPKIRRRIVLSAPEQEAFLSAVGLLAVWVSDRKAGSPIVAEDPSDDSYILAALEGMADCVVSGDAHLLRLGKYEGVAIVSPREFLRRI